MTVRLFAYLSPDASAQWWRSTTATQNQAPGLKSGLVPELGLNLKLDNACAHAPQPSALSLSLCLSASLTLVTGSLFELDLRTLTVLRQFSSFMSLHKPWVMLRGAGMWDMSEARENEDWVSLNGFEMATQQRSLATLFGIIRRYVSDVAPVKVHSSGHEHVSFTWYLQISLNCPLVS